MLTREEAIECFEGLAYEYSDYEGMKNALESMRLCNEISDEDYKYIIKHWDELLPEDLEDKE